MFSAIPSTYLGPEGDYVIPQLGPLSIDDARSPHLTRFLDELSACLQRWDAAPGSDDKKLTDARGRLCRSAVRFLETGDDVGFDGDVNFSENQPPGVVLNYVTALENLLSSNDEDKVDLRRRAAQRAAILIGRDDAHRTIIYDQVYSAYGVRNKIAHGGKLDSKKLADAAGHLRPILRGTLISAVVLGPRLALSELCDEALLSHTVLHEQVRTPLDRFCATVRAG